MAIRRKVSNGPSKHDLQLSLFEGKHVHFVLEGRGPLEAVVQRVSLEDGSLQKWIIAGYFIRPYAQGRWQAFSGYYDSQRRHGILGAANDTEDCKTCGMRRDEWGTCEAGHLPKVSETPDSMVAICG